MCVVHSCSTTVDGSTDTLDEPAYCNGAQILCQLAVALVRQCLVRGLQALCYGPGWPRSATPARALMRFERHPSEALVDPCRLAFPALTRTVARHLCRARQESISYTCATENFLPGKCANVMLPSGGLPSDHTG